MSAATRSREDGAKRPTDVSLSETLATEAKVLGVDVSRACEQGLAAEMREEKARQWLAENQAGFDSWNAYIDRHGIPLSEYRKI